MKRQWFKFYGQDFMTDPKMLALTSTQKVMWITLLALVSTSEEEGIVKNLTEERLKLLSGVLPNSQFDDEWTETNGTLKKFEELKMITIDRETINVINFPKRQAPQDSYDPDAINERVKRFRNKDTSLQETKRNDRGEEIRGDKNRIDKNISIVGETDKEWTFKSFLEGMDNHKRRDFQIMAAYWDFKGIKFTNKEQAYGEIKRLLRAAKALEPYEDDKIVKTMNWLKKNADFKWSLESVIKFINEDLNKLKSKL